MITNWTPTILNRPKGRPKERRLDTVWANLKITGVLDLERECFRQERKGKNYLSKPKPIQGCRA
jgi:hypothetical protein